MASNTDTESDTETDTDSSPISQITAPPEPKSKYKEIYIVK